MMIIEAMKKIKDLQRKASDLRDKVRKNSAHLSIYTPEYENQGDKIRSWVDAHHDILKEILSLRARISKTNIHTEVTIELGGNKITRTIAEWIHRRRDLADLDRAMYQSLTDRGLQEGRLPQGQQQAGKEREDVEVKIVRYYDAAERDHKIDQFTSEPVLIDSRLEVINATTELMDL